ncbi:unnamed protein product [Sympodiomycopsis kandeliae]
MSLQPPATEEELQLIDFLSSDNWQVRNVALSTLAGYSLATHPRRNLLLQESPKNSIESIKKLVTDLPPTAHDAFSILVNLSNSIINCKKIGTDDFIKFLITYIFHPGSLLADLACMLLSNLTKLDSISKCIIDLKLEGESLGMPGTQISALELLLAAFDQGATVVSTNQHEVIQDMKKKALEAGIKPSQEAADSKEKQQDRKSHCNFLASVFANVTVLPAGREFFTTPLSADDHSTIPAGRLFSYTEHPDLIRRGGCISSLKNILFIKSVHSALLAPPSDGSTLTPPLTRPNSVSSSDLDILPSLLLPLCTGKLFESLDDEEQDSLPEELQFLEEDKKLEKDSALRSMLVECLLLLGSTLYGRRCMRERGVYVVVRELHKNEIDERIGESVLRLVNILKREESQATLQDLEQDPHTEEGRSEDQKAIDALISAEDVSKPKSAEEEEEEDMVIEEL